MAPNQDSQLVALVYQYLISQEYKDAAKALKKKLGSVCIPTLLTLNIYQPGTNYLLDLVIGGRGQGRFID
jgi:hypothetical protein